MNSVRSTGEIPSREADIDIHIFAATTAQVPERREEGGRKGYNLDRLWSEGGRQAYKAPGNTFEDPYSVTNHMFVMRGASSKKHTQKKLMH